MTPKRIPPFTVTLTKDERERFEAHRSALGMRSLADVVRHWINSGPITFTQDGVHVRLSERVTYPVAETGPLTWVGPMKAPPGSRLKKR